MPPLFFLENANANANVMHLLVIEDDAQTRSYLVRGLTESGHVADAAGEGHEGLQLASAQSYDALIVAVEAGSPAAARGIRVGDVILMVGQKRVANLDEAIEAINEVKAQKRGNLLLQISRGNELRFLTVPLS